MIANHSSKAPSLAIGAPPTALIATADDDDLQSTASAEDGFLCAEAASAELAKALMHKGKGKGEVVNLPGIEHSGFALFKQIVGVIAKRSPALAARAGMRVLTTPPHAKPKASHHALVASAQDHFSIRVGRISARGYAWGSGPAVIFSHGWCADASWFEPYISPLVERGFQVVAFDAPGHGLSARARADMFDFAACISVASDWVVNRGQRVQGVVGHSFGGVAAALAMRDWGIPCDRLALISAFIDCNWVTDAFIQMAALPAEVGVQMREQYVGFGRGALMSKRTSVIDMIRQTPKHVFLAHDRNDPDVPFWHALALFEGCKRAQLYQTSWQGHRRVVREPGVVAAVVDFVSNESK